MASPASQLSRRATLEPSMVRFAVASRAALPELPGARPSIQTLPVAALPVPQNTSSGAGMPGTGAMPGRGAARHSSPEAVVPSGPEGAAWSCAVKLQTRKSSARATPACALTLPALSGWVPPSPAQARERGSLAPRPRSGRGRDPARSAGRVRGRVRVKLRTVISPSPYIDGGLSRVPPPLSPAPDPPPSPLLVCWNRFVVIVLELPALVGLSPGVPVLPLPSAPAASSPVVPSPACVVPSPELGPPVSITIGA